MRLWRRTVLVSKPRFWAQITATTLRHPKAVSSLSQTLGLIQFSLRLAALKLINLSKNHVSIFKNATTKLGLIFSNRFTDWDAYAVWGLVFLAAIRVHSMVRHVLIFNLMFSAHNDSCCQILALIGFPKSENYFSSSGVTEYYNKRTRAAQNISEGRVIKPILKVNWMGHSKSSITTDTNGWSQAHWLTSKHRKWLWKN